MREVIRVAPNAADRDFVAGDIHGCFSTLEAALAELHFEPERDRLFSLGDLIDYGTRSADALEWMHSRFTATVRGNHEDMMLDYLRIGARMHNDGGAWRLHWASSWFPDSSTPESEQRKAWRRALEALPFTLTVALPDGGRVGLVHGYAGLVRPVHDLDWDDLCTLIARDRHAAWGAMWTRPTARWRSRTDPRLPPGIAGVDYVCHGHDPGPAPAWSARGMLCIDTGVHVPGLGHLTIAELHPRAPVLHSFERIDILLPEPKG